MNIMTGGDELGQMMVEHPKIAQISFTGSAATGKKIMATGAATLKKVTLELGGNDPAVVLPDVEPQDVAAKIFQGAMFNTGQVCVAIKRVFVHESRCAPLAPTRSTSQFPIYRSDQSLSPVGTRRWSRR
jgi:acyl-CoA reductase-like NAD-dependent aldehyde dehydrogenase